MHKLTRSRNGNACRVAVNLLFYDHRIDEISNLERRDSFRI